MPALPKIPTIPSGPSRHVYDVIIVGGQVGGALAAALIAKRGLRALLVEHDGMGPGYEHDGFLLPYAPFIAPAFKSMPQVEDALTELGLTTSVQRALRPHQPALQLILPNHRVDVHLEEARRLAELTREFGPGGAAIQSALKSLAAYHEQTDAFFKEPLELPPDGFMESWGIKGAIKKFPALEAAPPEPTTDEATALAFQLAPFVSYLAAPQTPLARGRALSQALQYPGRYPAGREGLRELLCKRFTDLGGELLAREGAETFIAEALEFDGDRVEGVKLVQSDTVYRGAAFVAATDAGALRRLIEDKRRHRKLTEQLDLSRTKSFLFTVNWVLPADVLPRGMGELLLVAPRDGVGPMLIEQHAARKVGAKGDDESLRVISAAAFIPASARDLGEAHLKAVAEQMGEALSGLMPFAKNRVLMRSAPYLDAGGVRGSRLLPHPLLTIETETLLGVEGLNQRTAAKNLVLASREVLPGLGLEGELLAGIRAARLVHDSLKKRDPLKR